MHPLGCPVSHLHRLVPGNQPACGEGPPLRAALPVDPEPRRPGGGREAERGLVDQVQVRRPLRAARRLGGRQQVLHPAHHADHQPDRHAADVRAAADHRAGQPARGGHRLVPPDHRLHDPREPRRPRHLLVHEQPPHDGADAAHPERAEGGVPRVREDPRRHRRPGDGREEGPGGGGGAGHAGLRRGHHHGHHHHGPVGGRRRRRQGGGGGGACGGGTGKVHIGVRGDPQVRP
mmetsp:Transcript_119955/g.373583  ORF Transcript_119955/g.373583 Transcript_119955/m.373583 type:complete len:233 (+) Transcript_119955:384-1082(+)